MGFTWDPAKARANRRKHGVDFADAIGAFEDPFALTQPDPFPNEARFATLGRDFLDRIIVVVWAYDDGRFARFRRAPRRRGNGGHTRRDSMPKELDFSRARRGAVVPAEPGKTRITIRVDTEVLEWFREQVHAAGGGNYQTLMNRALRSTMDQARESLEKVLRRVVREELTRGATRAPRRVRARAV